MRAVVQRVKKASVLVADKTIGEIDGGLVVLLGVKSNDTAKEADWLADKIVNLRIFPDEADKMNRSLLDSNGEMLIVSQFTLYGDCSHGRRPGFTEATVPEEANRLYEYFVKKVSSYGTKVATGRFQTKMLVKLENDGPVTLIVESK